MGLDMFFSAKKHSDNETRTEVKKIAKGFCEEWEVREIVYEVLYLRKANAIHDWFVENVQDGEDDCKEYHVPHSKIVDLYDIICEVLKNRERASELLPTTNGFFFGSTEYDEWYFDGLEYTQKVFEPIVEAIKAEDMMIYDFVFYYRSSW